MFCYHDDTATKERCYIVLETSAAVFIAFMQYFYFSYIILYLKESLIKNINMLKYLYYNFSVLRYLFCSIIAIYVAISIYFDAEVLNHSNKMIFYTHTEVLSGQYFVKKDTDKTHVI